VRALIILHLFDSGSIDVLGGERTKFIHIYPKLSKVSPWVHINPFQPVTQRCNVSRDAGTMWSQGGRFSWKGTFELIYTKRCLQNIGNWTSLDHVFYLLDDRGVRGFSARWLCYSWSSMTAFLAFSNSEANSEKNCTNILKIRYFSKAIL
jgi:hypothetical protein